MGLRQASLDLEVNDDPASGKLGFWDFGEDAVTKPPIFNGAPLSLLLISLCPPAWHFLCSLTCLTRFVLNLPDHSLTILSFQLTWQGRN